MEENTPQSTPGRLSRRRYIDNDDDGGDLVDCSGKNCRSCTAIFVADCVAVCCCPCSLVSFLALALVKVPWMIGRKCLKHLKKKKKKKKVKRGESESDNATMEAIDGIGKDLKLCGEGGVLEKISSGFCEEEEIENFSARFEAERIWLQLYQIGQLGFGRVSFTRNTNLWLNTV